jgi:branched-subunit amino acid transport protein
VVAGVGLTAIVLKASGPVLLGRRNVSTRLAGAIDVLPIAILSALVVSQTFVTDRSIGVDARIIGIFAAVVLIWRRAPLAAVVVVSAAATASARGLGWTA